MASVLVIDFGSQVTQLIVRRVREAGVYCEVAPFHSAQKALEQDKPKAIILSGGPDTTMREGSPRAPESVFKLGVPVLGICYGQQTLVTQLGGKVEPHDKREFGRAEIEIGDEKSAIRGRLAGRFARYCLDEPWRPRNGAPRRLQSHCP